MKLIYVIFLFVTTLLTASEKDSLYVQFAGDTVKIWNAAELNCCSLMKFEAERNGYQIKLTEIDTAKNWCHCLCNFELCASLNGLQSGTYTVEVFRNYPLSYPPDSLFYVGTISFDIAGEKSPFLSNSFQSGCISDYSGSAEISLPKDSLFVEILNDTVKIWNYNVYTNCCSYFEMQAEVSQGTIKLFEIDTSMQLCNCLCSFNLWGSVVNLRRGYYKTEVYRLSKYFGDSLYVGSLEFFYPGSAYSVFPVRSYQSKCLNEEQDEVLIYSNSFESEQDTAGWNGYIDFRSEAAPQGGNFSAFVSGGCIWPHAWYELPALSESGNFILRCWGKNLQIGGIVGMRTEPDFSDEINITINGEEWTFYESTDTLYCPAGKSITLFMGAGGIVPSSILVDKLEIVKIATSTPTAIIGDQEINSVSSFTLFQNYPNPFNPVTKIKYIIPVSDKVALVSLKIYDILGNTAAIIVDGIQTPGIHEAEFDGSSLTSGIYVYILSINDKRAHRKMCLIK